jgi:pimeloyl-ACP methyl ester carboxylesterase
VNHRIIAALIPHATLHIVRGGGHLALLESAQQVGPLIAGFLQDDRAASDAAAAQPSWRR